MQREPPISLCKENHANMFDCRCGSFCIEEPFSEYRMHFQKVTCREHIPGVQKPGQLYTGVSKIKGKFVLCTIWRFAKKWEMSTHLPILPKVQSISLYEAWGFSMHIAHCNATVYLQNMHFRVHVNIALQLHCQCTAYALHIKKWTNKQQLHWSRIGGWSF